MTRGSFPIRRIGQLDQVAHTADAQTTVLLLKLRNTSLGIAGHLAHPAFNGAANVLKTRRRRIRDDGGRRFYRCTPAVAV
ncbi:hypothetical protein I7I50_09460 [Histoplasma capsulatum G186AR]|uniref:Uncharacterized protein n=1 Tax=Ajellomyces capsulatus TaxID=5037 RepID=A0A8H7YVF9_AJECA|nr:hypothetical protein I7I52_06981 [Histoplasma capsulatum]QSS74337.1 hypothetical protein I7I50_09460 [Histoplasma capsulatum G186AR]